ncbi:MAG: ABC transporter ATP-binding protein [Gammaproteobacteria bacterium]
MALIEIVALTKSYPTAAGPVPVLKGIDIRIGEGEFVAIMGPSGSGKSTFMNIVGCLDRPSSGSYRLGGQDIEGLSADALAQLRNRTIGFVFQGFNLLARADLQTNVALPLIYSGVGRQERLQRARDMLGQVGLGAFVDYRPNQVSGGQQQRVAIARALIADPPLILADEPTGNLDSATSADIMHLLRGLNARHGITIVLVTHEPDVAAYARRLVRFRDGRIVDDSAMVAAETMAT